MPKKKTRRYGDYVCEIDKKIYAVVRLPLGNGKYKKKVKLLSLLGNGTKTEAAKWAWDELELWKKGEAREKDKLTFSDLAAWYKKEFLVAPVYQGGKRLIGVRTYKQLQAVLERLKKYFGLFRIERIGLDVLRRYKRERLRTVSIVSVNRDFALVRTMLKKAKTRHWLKESPFEMGENLIEMSLESSRESPLTPRLAKRLLARSRKSAQPLLHYLILTMMHTGARPSEVFPFHAGTGDDVPREPLIWKSILDFDYKAVRLISYKGRIRKERLIPTSVELERGLRKMYAETNPASDEDLLFPVKGFNRSWATLCRSVKCTGVWLRDFRHYFNSQILVNEKFNDVERMLLLGQSRISTNLRYSHLDESFIKKFRDDDIIVIDGAEN